MSLAYVQRLLDRAAQAPSAAAARPGVQPAGRSLSPIALADQRLNDPQLAASPVLLGAFLDSDTLESSADPRAPWGAPLAPLRDAARAEPASEISLAPPRSELRAAEPVAPRAALGRAAPPAARPAPAEPAAALEHVPPVFGRIHPEDLVLPESAEPAPAAPSPSALSATREAPAAVPVESPALRTADTSVLRSNAEPVPAERRTAFEALPATEPPPRAVLPEPRPPVTPGERSARRPPVVQAEPVPRPAPERPAVAAALPSAEPPPAMPARPTAPPPRPAQTAPTLVRAPVRSAPAAGRPSDERAVQPVRAKRPMTAAEASVIGPLAVRPRARTLFGVRRR